MSGETLKNHSQDETVETLKSDEVGPVKLSVIERAKLVFEDEEAKEGLKACARLAANLIITGADATGVGDALSIVADIGKLNEKLDLTPDVSKEIAWYSELLELGGPVIPTHAIETTLQAKADYDKGKLETGKDALAYLLTGKGNYAESLNNNSKELDKAAGMFVREESPYIM